LMISIRVGLVWLGVVLASLATLLGISVNGIVVMGETSAGISMIILSFLSIGGAMLSIVWERERKRYLEFIKMCDVEHFGRKRMDGLSKLAGSMAHHINNPLCVLMGHNDYFLDGLEQLDINQKERQEWRDCLLANRLNIARISKLTTSLLTYTGHYSDVEISTKRLGDFVELIKYQVGKLDGIELLNITYQVKGLDGPLISGQIDLLVHLFVNLFTNSSEALQGVPGAWVRLEVESEQREAKFIITDSGGGISAEVQDHMFEPFFTSRNIVERTGIGLYLCRSLVQQYGGDIRYNSKCKNTQFIVTLPLID
ncbi:MAG: HAMP domain-containing histidine kinase, partial [Bdellovibrionales bacterium]|nr:HAMP domain-containing histidine kinase [Bdellovibrionales bacterium]